MSRRIAGLQAGVRGGFLLIELVGGIALLGLCGLIFAMMQGRITQGVQQAELTLRAVTELDMAMEGLERDKDVLARGPVEKGPFTIRYKDWLVPPLMQPTRLMAGRIPFRLVEVTISWKNSCGNEQKINGFGGVIV